jgi:hypothetical protein
MNFEFINELRLLLDDSNIFKWTIVGAKSVAMFLLIFKLMEIFVNSTLYTDEGAPKIAGLFNLFAYAFLIISSDWIVNTIENIFVVIDTTMVNTEQPNAYQFILDKLMTKYAAIWDGVDGVFDSLDFFIKALPGFLVLIIGIILALLCMIADVSLTCGYLLTRLFMIEVMKFVFPIVIALSTLDMTKDLLGRWIKKFIGLFVLGILYLGIINFSELLATTLLNQFDMGLLNPNSNSESIGATLYIYTVGGVIAIIVVFTTKIKLMAKATEFSNSFFS